MLVPISAFQPRGQTKYSILDGERRYRCVVDLTKEGVRGPDKAPLKLPANIVEPPTKIAGMLYMFSIHNFRESWEPVPTALSLKIVMDELGEEDNAELNKLTGLGETLKLNAARNYSQSPKSFRNSPSILIRKLEYLPTFGLRLLRSSTLE